MDNSGFVNYARNPAGDVGYYNDPESDYGYYDGSSDYDDSSRSIGIAVFEEDASVYGQAIAMGFISIVGLILNAVVILVICALQDYKKTSHWYVLNLALADSFFLLMLPLNMVEVLTQRWSFGAASEHLCITYVAAFYVNYYAGIFFLMVMSIDRYAAIIHPMSSRWRKLRSRKVCWFLTVAVWIIAVLAALPLLTRVKIMEQSCGFDFNTGTNEDHCVDIGIKPEHCETYNNMFPSIYEDSDHNETLTHLLDNMMKENHDECYHENPYLYHLIWIYCNVFLAFFVPIIIMIFCYGCILWRVLHPRILSRDFTSTKGSGKSFLRRNSSSKMNSMKRRNNIRVTVLVVSLVVAFICCWAPFNISQLVKIGGISYITKSQCRIFDIVVRLIAYSNSLWNPLLYTFLGANFHKRVGRVWKRIQSRNAATKELIASFRNTKRGNYTGFRGSAASKITKTTDSMVSGATSNINVSPTACKDGNTYSTTGFKT